MKIKELEQLLSVSRSNIRFYEKQGLFCPERKDNNYREYSEADVEALKKIIVLRKMGFTVEEIQLIQKGELPFAQAMDDARQRLEEEIEKLNGSLKLVEQVAKENGSFEEIDIDKHFDAINSAERSGEKFIDICKDYLELELRMLDTGLMISFLFPFKMLRKRYGTMAACLMLLLWCILRGIARFRNGGSFWYGFLYPFTVFLIASAIVLPLFLLNKKYPKVASVITNILLGCGIVFFAGLFLLIAYGIIRKIIT